MPTLPTESKRPDKYNSMGTREIRGSSHIFQRNSSSQPQKENMTGVWEVAIDFSVGLVALV